ncbi:MAG: HAD family hydrolase [Chlamydiota bacterium]|nr:HAD family hydrolase [Chlamydiota bacterium]
MFNNIKAVYFDYGGTLDADGIPWKDHFQRIYHASGIQVPQNVFDRAFYDADDLITNEGLDQVSLKDTLDLQVKLVLNNLGSDMTLLGKIANTFYQDTLQKIKENKNILEALRTRYQLGIISNFYGNLDTICEELQLDSLFGAVIDSNRVGFTKPDPEIFYCALKALNVNPSNAVFVGDSLKRDMLGAKAIGMAHIFLSPINDKTSSSVNCCPHPVIHQLSTLLELL